MEETEAGRGWHDSAQGQLSRPEEPRVRGSLGGPRPVLISQTFILIDHELILID